MLKIETYSRPEISAQVWKLTISDYELIQLDLTPQEKAVLEKCNEPGAPISMVALGLALLARKIEMQANGAPNNGLQSDLLPAPACCASFVAYGEHHKDCRFAQSASR